MSDDLGHYFEVAPEQVDPRRREAVAAVAPLLVADLRLAALGLRGGLVVKWFRPTTPMQFPVVLPGALPPAGFVAVRGLQGLCRGRDPDGVVWLHADLPPTPDRDGLLWVLAHEAKHAQTLLRPGRAYEVVGEGSCEVYAERFCAALKGEGPLRPGIRARPPKPKAAGRPRRRTSGGRGTRTGASPGSTSKAGGEEETTMVATTTDAERRMAGRELAEWRAALPVGREQLAREENTLAAQRARYDRILGEKQAVGAEIARRAVEEHDAWQAGRDRWGALDQAEGQAVVALHALEAQVARRREALGRVEQAVRERARDLGVRLEPGEVPDPPPDPPPGPPGEVEATLAWRRRAEAG